MTIGSLLFTLMLKVVTIAQLQEQKLYLYGNRTTGSEARSEDTLHPVPNTVK